MYLHLGKDIAIWESDIVGIFDLDTTTYSKKTREFIHKHEQEKRVVNVFDDIPKSFVLCGNKKKSNVYIVQISSATLLKRTVHGTLPDNYIE